MLTDAGVIGKMAAMPILVQNLTSPEPKVHQPWILLSTVMPTKSDSDVIFVYKW